MGATRSGDEKPPSSFRKTDAFKDIRTKVEVPSSDVFCGLPSHILPQVAGGVSVGLVEPHRVV
eukprot:8975092-Pyramimonas_sp.AAC.1